MPEDPHQTQLTDDINCTLSEAMITFMAEIFAVQQRVSNIPSYDDKNMLARNFIQGIISWKSSP